MTETFPPSFSLVHDKVNYRRKLVRKLCIQGHNQREIAEKLRVSLSTIEKDFHALRKEWRAQDHV